MRWLWFLSLLVCIVSVLTKDGDEKMAKMIEEKSLLKAKINTFVAKVMHGLHKIMMADIGLRVEEAVKLKDADSKFCIGAIADLKTSVNALHFMLLDEVRSQQNELLADIKGDLKDHSKIGFLKSNFTYKKIAALNSILDNLNSGLQDTESEPFTSFISNIDPACLDILRGEISRLLEHEALIESIYALAEESEEYIYVSKSDFKDVSITPDFDLDTSESQLSQMEGDIYNLEIISIPDIRGRLSKLSSELTELISLSNSRDSDIDLLVQKKNFIAKALDDANKNLAEEIALQDKALPLKGLAVVVRDRVNQLKDLQSNSADLQSRVNELETTVAQLTKVNEENMSKLASASGQIANSDNSRGDSQNAIADAASASFVVNQVKQKLMESQAQLADSTNQLLTLTASIEDIQKSLDDSEQQLMDKYLEQMNGTMDKRVHEQANLLNQALQVLNGLGGGDASPTDSGDKSKVTMDEVLAIALDQASHAEKRIESFTGQVDLMILSMNETVVDIDNAMDKKDKSLKDVDDKQDEINKAKIELDSAHKKLLDTHEKVSNQRPLVLVYQTRRDIFEMLNSMDEMYAVTTANIHPLGEISSLPVSVAPNNDPPVTDSDVILSWIGGDNYAKRLDYLENSGLSYINSQLQNKKSLRQLLIQNIGYVPYSIVGDDDTSNVAQFKTKKDNKINIKNKGKNKKNYTSNKEKNGLRKNKK